MANEELGQRGYIQKGELKGDGFGAYEQFNIGATSVTELVKAGLPVLIPSKVPFKFIEYKATKNTKNAKVDRLYVDRRSGTLKPIFVAEWKQATEFNDEKKKTRACEQALFDAYVFGVDWACATDGSTFIYIDVKQSIADGILAIDPESRALTPAIIEDLLSPKTSLKDPTDLAKRIWQKIWQATKEEPKACLLTFVELFMLKFLSDNLLSKCRATCRSTNSLLEAMTSLDRSMASHKLNIMLKQSGLTSKACFLKTPLWSATSLPNSLALNH
jgi:type I restriction enzyme M protein